MSRYKLTIDLLPRGAWGNDFSKTLGKRDWDRLREACYERAGNRCEICGARDTELDAHEVWDFDIKRGTQTLTGIIALCSACHGVKHMRNSERIGYGESSKRHFMNVNKCSSIDFAGHYAEAQAMFEARNKVLRWKVIADLARFGGEGNEVPERYIPYIISPYEGVRTGERYGGTRVKSGKYEYIGPPKLHSIEVDNYQGTITVVSSDTNKIEWSLDGQYLKTKYNVVGKFTTTLKVEDLRGKKLRFRLTGEGGETYSEMFELVDCEDRRVV